MAEERADLTVVGGGVSCVAVLEQLLARLRMRPHRRLRVLVLDRAGEFGGGVPYGRSVSPGCLCNDPVGRQHPGEFPAWLHARRDAWLGRLEASGDPSARHWLLLNAGPLAAARGEPSLYAGLFVPRLVYGEFMRGKLAGFLAAACTPEVSLRRERVTGIARDLPGFRLTLAGGATVVTRLVLLAIGSPPPRPEPELADESGYLPAPCTADPVQLAAALADNPAATVAILGGNACALEAVSLLATHPELRRRLAGVSCITQGTGLPDAAPSARVATPVLAALAALEEAASPAADTLFAAACADVTAARAAGFTALDYADPLHARVVGLLARLTPGERRRFAETHGRRFKALARHTPPEYRQSAQHLAADGLLRVLRGRVLAVRPLRPGCRVLWQDHAGTGQALRASVVLDCRGWGHLDEAGDPLLQSLLAPDAALACMNRSRIGLAVDEAFQAAPGLFVMGPLLAGCSNDRHSLWNLENARRIFALAPALAESLASRLAGSPGRP